MNIVPGELKQTSSNPKARLRGKLEPSRTNLAGLTPGLVCFFCKKRDHVKAECQALQRKNAKSLMVALKSCTDTPFPEEDGPFISSGTFSAEFL